MVKLAVLLVSEGNQLCLSNRMVFWLQEVEEWRKHRKLLDLHIEDPGARGDEPRQLNLTETASWSILNAGFQVSLFFIVFSLLHVSRTFLELDAV